ncbi:serine hydrolase family protein [Candidatus Woesearchaeota archaeon]|nr:serine hydrolase family protein [Candidatus Woesearchaeota archaeon]
MANIFIFHGTGGYPEENWFPWLKQKLENLNCKVIIPQFPTPENQSLENWLKILSNYQKFYNQDTILIGHSLGRAFLLRVIENYDAKIKSSFLVGTPIGILPIKNYESDKLFLGEFSFDWKKIKNNCKKFFIYHSDNDPYVSLGNGKELAKNLVAKLICIPNAGHFNKRAGYTAFEKLFEDIKKEL